MAGRGLTCAREESKCAGSDSSESELGRMAAPIRCGRTSLSTSMPKNTKLANEVIDKFSVEKFCLNTVFVKLPDYDQSYCSR